jgi:hypothetical protein
MWEQFVAEYASDGIYWYFPKGGTPDTLVRGRRLDARPSEEIPQRAA